MKERKMEWLLIDGSSPLQQTRQNPSQTEGEPHQDWNYPCINASAALTTLSDSPCLSIAKQTIIVVFLAVVLSIATRPGCVFGRFNNEYKWEKSGLNNSKYGFDCDASSPTDNTMNASGVAYAPVFNYVPTGIGFAVTNEIEFDLIPATTTTAAATTTINENETQMIFNSAPLWAKQTQTQTQTQAHHPIDSGGVGLVEFNNIRCILIGHIDRIGLQYDMLAGMFIFIFIFLVVLWWNVNWHSFFC